MGNKKRGPRRPGTEGGGGHVAILISACSGLLAGAFLMAVLAAGKRADEQLEDIREGGNQE